MMKVQFNCTNTPAQLLGKWKFLFQRDINML